MGNSLFYPIRQLRGYIYNTLILKMTTKWYQTVLGRLDEGSVVLDVGIGTAGALLKCKDVLLDRKIRVVGLDYDADYVAVAQEAIRKAELANLVSVIEMSVYEVEQEKLLLPGETKAIPFDAVYFSGSFSLLPDMCGALRAVTPLLSEEGQIFITQTYQRYSPPLLSYIKPVLRYLTTIDFGKLIFEDEIADFFNNKVPKECKLDCVEHRVIKGSVDSYLQAAYLTVFKQVR